MHLLMAIKSWKGTVPPPTIIKPRPLWTGNQLFSLLLPSSLSLTASDSSYSRVNDVVPPILLEMNSRVLIKRGELIYGRLCKDTFGPSRRIMKEICQCGTEIVCQFFNDAQSLANEYLLYRGFSFGIEYVLLHHDSPYSIFT